MYNSRELKKTERKLDKRNPFKKDIIWDPQGQYNHPRENTRIPSSNITMKNIPYPVFAVPNVGAPMMMHPDQNYNFPGADYVDEYPMMDGYHMMPDGTMMSNDQMQDGGTMDGMMKSKLAYESHFGNNPAIQRMISGVDEPYKFEDGKTGTHFMASSDNYAVPQIQDQNGSLQLEDYDSYSKEAIRFNSSEEADYFAKNYKKIAPAFQNFQDGGYVDMELTEDEIADMRAKGYRIDEL